MSTGRRRGGAPRRLATVAAAALALAGAACGSDASTATSSSSTTTPGVATGTITVSAAASLTEVFTALGHDFESDHAGTTVRFNFDSSTTLARQIVAGAPADVFASADVTDMTELVDAHLIDGSPVNLARNRLVIATKPGNPRRISGLADLAAVEGVISLCAATAPCGRYADRALSAAKVTLTTTRITRGQNARATLAAVSTGDADAAIVYATDAAAAGAHVATVAIPDEQNVTAAYPIATVASSANPALARAFVAFVRTPAAVAALEAAGFLAP